MRTGVAADTGEAVLQHTARQKLVGHLPDNRAARALLAREALVVDRLQAVQMI